MKNKMNRLFSLVLVMAMVLSIVPVTYATEDKVYVYSFGYKAMGKDSGASGAVFEYGSFDEIVENVSAPWRLVGFRTTPNTVVNESDIILTAGKGDATFDHFTAVFKIKVEKSGTYIPTISYNTLPEGYKVAIILAKESASDPDMSAVNNAAVKQYINAHTKDIIGRFDMCAPEEKAMSTSFSAMTLEVGTYNLLIVSDGLSENYSAASGKIRAKLSSFELDGTSLRSFNATAESGAELPLSEKTQIISSVTLESGRTYATDSVTYKSLTEEILSVNDSGEVLGLAPGEGVIRVTYTPDGTFSDVEISVLKTEAKFVYDYNFGSDYLSTTTDGRLTTLVKKPMEFSDVNESKTDKWRAVGISAVNSAQINATFAAWNSREANAAFNRFDMVFELEVKSDGKYTPILNYIAIPKGYIMQAYLIKKTGNEADMTGLSNEAAIRSLVSSNPDSLIGEVDLFAETETVKATGFLPVSLTRGNYYLIFVSNGRNEAVAKYSDGYIYARVASFSLDAKDATEIEIKRESPIMNVGAKMKLSAFVTYESGHICEVPDGISYSSSDESVATVDANGNVEAKKVGNSVVKAQIGEAITETEIRVVDDSTVSELHVDFPEVIGLNETVEINVRAINFAGGEIENPEITYENLSQEIVKVDSDGVVQGLNTGKAELKIKCGDIEKSISAIVCLYDASDKEIQTFKYKMGTEYMNDPTTVAANKWNLSLFDEYEEVNLRKTMPWKHVAMGNLSHYDLRGEEWRRVQSDAGQIIRADGEKLLRHWVAYKIYVPKEGSYKLFVNPIKKTSSRGVRFFWLEDKDVSTLSGAKSRTVIASDEEFVGSVNFYHETNTSEDTEFEDEYIGEVLAEKPGTYIIVLSAEDGITAEDIESNTSITSFHRGFTLEEIDEGNIERYVFSASSHGEENGSDIIFVDAFKKFNEDSSGLSSQWAYAGSDKVLGATAGESHTEIKVQSESNASISFKVNVTKESEYMPSLKAISDSRGVRAKLFLRRNGESNSILLGAIETYAEETGEKHFLFDSVYLKNGEYVFTIETEKSDEEDATLKISEFLLDASRIVDINPRAEQTEIGLGEETRIVATVTRASGITYNSIVGLSFKSVDSSIAYTDNNGKITSGGDEIGDAEFVVSYDVISKPVKVTVFDRGGISSADIRNAERVFYIGENTELFADATLKSGIELSGATTVWSSGNTDVAYFDGNVLVPVSVGNTNVIGIVSYFGSTYEISFDIEIRNDEYYAAEFIDLPPYVNIGEGKIEIFAVASTAVRRYLDLESAEMTFESSDESVAAFEENYELSQVQKDGEEVSAARVGLDLLSCGETILTARITLGEITKTAEITLMVQDGKVGRTYWTEEIVAAMRQNAEKDSELKTQRKDAIEKADKYVEFGYDKLWRMVTAEGLPRSSSIKMSDDPNRSVCPYCQEDLYSKYAHYPWQMNPITNEWKIQCPECKRHFPSNDFGSFYELGINEYGVFDRELAHKKNAELVANGERGYLVNELYPEIGNENCHVELTGSETPEGWAVDDGFGYETGRTYGNNIKEKYVFIACYNHLGLWEFNGSYGKSNGSATISDALNNLSLAYLYTGEAKYGRTGAILLDRVADVYPDFDQSICCMGMANADGSADGCGKVVGGIWETYLAPHLIKAYDAFYPAFEDKEVLNFLGEKSREYIIGDKSTPAAIRKNCEDGILRGVFDGIKEGEITGNFGMKESALGMAAIVLDSHPETDEMIDFIFRSGKLVHDESCTGCGVNDKLISEVSRDGQGGEVSVSYNGLWIEELANLADTLARYDEYSGTTLYENPKYVKMFTSYAPLTMVRKGFLPLGDGSYVGHFASFPSKDMLANAFAAVKDEESRIVIGQHLYCMNGNSAEGLMYNAYSLNRESLEKDIEKLIETHGEYNYDDSTLYSGYGLAALRSGSLYKNDNSYYDANTQRDFWIYFGGAFGHKHEDTLHLGIDAFGIAFASDNGYPEMASTDPNRSQWHNATLSHNTITVDEETQLLTNKKSQFPLHFDDTDDMVRVMDIDAPEVYKQTDMYRRTVVMVDYDDENSYGVDFFRVKGGDDHLYSFYAMSKEVAEYSDNLEFTKQTDEDGNYVGSYAGADVPFGKDPATVIGHIREKTMYPRGYTWLFNVDRDDSPETGEFFVDYKVRDFRKFLNASHDFHLRVTMLNDFELSEVSFADGCPPRNPRNINAGLDSVRYMLARRSGRNLDSLFTTVFEPYDESRYVTGMSQVDVRVVSGEQKKGDVVKAVKVEFENGRCDYIVYSSSKNVTYNVDGLFDFSGFVGVYSINSEGANIYSYVQDGTIIGTQTYAKSEITGRIKNFTKELSFDNEIEIALDSDATANDLTGRLIIVENDNVQNGAYMIQSAEMKNPRLAVVSTGDITFIRDYIDSDNEALGYEYNIAKGQKVSIPMSYAVNNRPIIDPIGNVTVSSGSSVSVKISARGAAGEVVTLKEGRLPRGASFDADAGVFTWKPSAGQIGDNHVSIKAVDSMGRENAVQFTVTVYGSTTGGGGGETTAKPDNTDKPEIPEIPESSDVPDANIRFVDLENHNWAADAINALAEDGIIKGTSVNTFSPGNNITRADFAILLVRAFGLESDNAENFADVSESDYFAKELAIARNTGLVGGVGDNKYAPRENITRQDMMVIVYRALKSTDKLVGADIIRPENEDFESVSDYAKEAISALISAGLVNGKNGKIAPYDYTTRAEVAVLLKRILDYIK
ncbi:MAG: S-layer homology domain-containing protein [Oscillospiraceae bacterium]|nr:S-layer homology domain-containing protein [Oscillospiraceae bacterium]MBQ7119711.1 S-layer homology domain-containing protein [Oscillospiraceae bacterium]